MKEFITKEIAKLYKGHIVDTVLYLTLILVVAVVTYGVLRHKLFDTKAKKLALVSLVALCSVGLIIVQIVTVLPFYKDYSQNSYIVVEDGLLDIVTESYDGKYYDAYVIDGDKQVKVKMKDSTLNSDFTYEGTFAYTKHSKYLVWYDLGLLGG